MRANFLVALTAGLGGLAAALWTFAASRIARNRPDHRWHEEFLRVLDAPLTKVERDPRGRETVIDIDPQSMEGLALRVQHLGDAMEVLENRFKRASPEG